MSQVIKYTTFLNKTNSILKKLELKFKLKERKNELGCYEESVVPGKYLLEIIARGFAVIIKLKSYLLTILIVP